MVGKVIQSYEGTMKKENLRATSFKILVNSRLNYKKGVILVTQTWMKKTVQGINGQNAGKDTEYEHNGVTKNWMEREYNNRIVDFGKYTTITIMQNCCEMKKVMGNVLQKIRNQGLRIWELLV